MDVQALVRAYEKKDCIDFPTFQAIWRKFKFHLIHFGCGDSNERHHFLRPLYRFFLDYLSPKETFPVQVGAIYGLYMLYFTQPTLFKKVPIPLDIATWQNLQFLYQLGFEYDATDLIFIVHRLRERNAFLYVAEYDELSKSLAEQDSELRSRDENTLIRMEKKMNSDILMPLDGLLKEVPRMAAAYHEAKCDLVSLSLARRASEKVMTALRPKKPPNMDPFKVKPIPEFLKTEIDPDCFPSDVTSHSRTSRSAEQINPAADREQDVVIESIEDSAAPKDGEPAVPSQPATGGLNEGALGAGQAVGGVAAAPNDTSAQPDLHLPFVFPLSMLQASQGNLPLRMEAMVRDYYKDRIARYEYAISGGLPANDYTFPESKLLRKRKKNSDGLTAKERARSRRKQRREQRRMEKAERREQQRTNAGVTTEDIDAEAEDEKDDGDSQGEDGPSGSAGSIINAGTQQGATVVQDVTMAEHDGGGVDSLPEAGRAEQDGGTVAGSSREDQEYAAGSRDELMSGHDNMTDEQQVDLSTVIATEDASGL
ncbi:Small nuclear RNA activating complex, polypeptide 1, 43kDa [Mortierella claussenii]|nr:Small nuclear RNA activating complex, polypeptide 1, 43kDa [Mortierella claussenii]